ncbi:TMN7 Transmembrane 9 superfamily member 7 [Candida maltosa Xu316]
MIVLIKVLKKDIQNTTSSPVALPTTSTDLGNTGGSWKNLINEINHVPRAELFLTTLVTAGIQFLIAGIGVIVALMLNSIGSKNTFFNTHQGALLSISIVIIIASGLVSSYVGILLHKYFRGDSLNQPYRNFQILKLGILYTSTPALLWVVMFILNVFVWAKESSAALPFETIILLFALFVLIQWPCGVIGARIANNQKFDIKSPPQSPMLEKPYQAITLLPRKSASKIINIFTSYLKTVVVYGLIPFGIVYVELSFILTSVFLEKTTFYYMYGFLFITVVMLVVLVIESTIIAVYVSLAVYNDPHWTWLSFQVGSSLGWYVFGYAIYYYVRVLNVEEFVSGLLYFVHMAIVSVIIGVSCGAIGVLTGLAFVRKIYGAIKVD